MSEKINTDHFSTMEELLEHLKNWERDDDIDAYYRFFSPGCAFELANKIERQQKEIKKEKSRIMELDELLDKQENEIKFLKGELEIQEGCSISKDKIREIIEHYNNELEHIKNGEEFENEKPMYYWGKVSLENLLEEN